MKKLPVLFILIVVTALIVSACSGPAPAPSGGGQAAPSGNATPKAQAPDKPAAKPTDKPGEPPATNSNSQATDLLELTDVTEGLNSLKSYESIFTMGFKGTDNSQPKEWSWTVTEQFVKEPPAKRSTIVGFGTDATGKDSTIETIEVGGKTYFGCCPMCKERLSTDAEARQAMDPVSGRMVDKAVAVIGVLPTGAVVYFESEANLAAHRAMLAGRQPS